MARWTKGRNEYENRRLRTGQQRARECCDRRIQGTRVRAQHAVHTRVPLVCTAHIRVCDDGVYLHARAGAGLALVGTVLVSVEPMRMGRHGFPNASGSGHGRRRTRHHGGAAARSHHACGRSRAVSASTAPPYAYTPARCMHGAEEPRGITLRHSGTGSLSLAHSAHARPNEGRHLHPDRDDQDGSRVMPIGPQMKQTSCLGGRGPAFRPSSPVCGSVFRHSLATLRGDILHFISTLSIECPGVYNWLESKEAAGGLIPNGKQEGESKSGALKAV
ncbi:hypothetical protein C8F04DRAFT_1315725 [Mycena alexandri]|uniref:Uncharacterized protein n=1 Tax=Mycena alexandri TaxID=1745969 RepID=A0AAD6WNC2_9AGAR|nr:hypothetical protein C8F04DRAFT_1315725 [Mycena alexandri]